jgi:hypothetical protein
MLRRLCDKVLNTEYMNCMSCWRHQVKITEGMRSLEFVVTKSLEYNSPCPPKPNELEPETPEQK